MSSSCEIAIRWMPQNTTSDDVNIGSGDGMEPSGNKHHLG